MSFQASSRFAAAVVLNVAVGHIACMSRQPAPSAPPVAATTAPPKQPAPTPGPQRLRFTKADDTRAILARLEPATVIGLGEQTHGSEENARVRAELVRELVDHLDVRTLALEADYAEVLKIDAFVQGGAGDAKTILAQQRAGWIWDKAALRDLLLWLRDLNSKRPEGERVHLVGIDMQTAFAIVASIDAQLEHAGKHEALRKKVANITSCDDPKLDVELKAELDVLVPKAPELAPLLRSLEQCKLAAAQGGAGEQARERGMADNLIALAETGGSVSPHRIVVLAHNAHISKTALGISRADPMGRLLGERMGAKYFAVGSVIGNGEFRAYRFDPATGSSKIPELLPLGEAPPDTVEAALLDREPFFLPLQSAPEAWYGEQRRMRIIGASYAPAYSEKYLHPVRVGVAFDALVYLPHA